LGKSFVSGFGYPDAKPRNQGQTGPIIAPA
jgi:hypothetical protein